ncbi:RNA polymerase sigma factor [Roseisolibacter sp. H3M3-2]|nr:RNA polymerase sigma factor [Roseisolibacter sp. H3M3-2]
MTAGDGAADFAALYRAHVGRVYALCLRMTGDAAAATELTQDVFVRAWERLATFRGESAVGTWLHRLAVNVVLERLRADRRRLARVEPAGDWLDDCAAPSPRDAVLERVDLDAALPRLAPGARLVFVLHDVEGYAHDEIARLTGLAPGTVRTQLHRARKHLSKLLRD